MHALADRLGGDDLLQQGDEALAIGRRHALGQLFLVLRGDLPAAGQAALTIGGEEEGAHAAVLGFGPALARCEWPSAAATRLRTRKSGGVRPAAAIRSAKRFEAWIPTWERRKARVDGARSPLRPGAFIGRKILLARLCYESLQTEIFPDINKVTKLTRRSAP